MNNAVVILLVFISALTAQSSELIITSNSSEIFIDENSITTVYADNVIARNQQIQGRGDKLTGVDPKSAEETVYTLTGQPAFLSIKNQQEQITEITAATIVFYSIQQAVTATGNVIIDNPDFNIQCHQANYKLDGSYSKCEKASNGPQIQTILKNTDNPQP